MLSVLAGPDRLRVIAALVLADAPLTVNDIATCTGLTARVVLRALARLESAAVVSQHDGRWSIHVEVIQAAARSDAAGPDADDTHPVLRRFLSGGRLTTIPAARTKRLAVLDHLAGHFEVGVRYSEQQVNEVLARFHPDTATLRRCLVDEQFLSRDHGVYWRTGGTVQT